MGKLKDKLPEGYSVLDKEGINQILIFEPRWHDNVVLVADRRLTDENEIIIMYHTFTRSYFISGAKAKQHPTKRMKTKAGYWITMREIPLDELEKEVIDA